MKQLVRLKPRDCRWPVADLTQAGERPGSGHRFCGARAQFGKPYCLEHRARAYDRQVVGRAAKPKKQAWVLASVPVRL